MRAFFGGDRSSSCRGGTGPRAWLAHKADQRFIAQELEPVRSEQSTSGKGNPVVQGRVMPYLQWSEIRSPIEGHFMEMFLPRAFREQVRDGIGAVRVLFEHGTDQMLGRQVIPGSRRCATCRTACISAPSCFAVFPS